MTPRVRAAVPALVVLTALAACTTPDPEPVAPTGASASPAPSGAATTVQVELLGAPVSVTVEPVEVVDDLAVLTIGWSMSADVELDAPINLATLLRAPGTFLNEGRLRLVDPSTARVWEVGTDQGRWFTTDGAVNLEPGAAVTTQAVLAAPDVETIGVLLPYLGLVEDVPVVEGDASTTPPTDLGATDEGTYVVRTTDAFTSAYDGSASTQVQGQDVTVTLASDVLFATDVADLDEAAAAVVDSAAEQIAGAAAAGDVVVVGHTDDVGSDAYNLDLSERRAASVAARLGDALGAGFTFTTEGRGEQEPVAQGTTDEARAANRRVEIRFTAQEAGKAVEVAPEGGEAPDAEGPVASGAGTVDVDVQGTTWRVGVEAVRRSGGYLVGTLGVERVSSGKGAPTNLFGDFATGRDLGRSFPATVVTSGAYGVTLLGEHARVHPADYVTDEDAAVRGVLADEFVDVPLEQSESVAVTVIWPDTGTATVDVDVENRFRITDVPVED